MASGAAFAATYLGGTIALAATANTNRDGTTGTYGTVLTATTAGLISQLMIVATGTTTAGVVRLFINGKLIHEELVTAITPSATIAVFQKRYTPRNMPDLLPIRVNAGDIIKASTHNAEAFTVSMGGGQV